MEAAAVLAILQLVGKLLDFAGKAKKNAARTGEWTEEERAAVEAAYKKQTESKAFKTDDEGG